MEGYIVDERSCFWTWDDNEYAWQSRPLKGRLVKRINGKVKVNADPEGSAEHSLSENKHKVLNGGQKRTLLGGPEEKNKKGWSKSNSGFQKGGFRPFQPDQGAGKDYTQNKDKRKNQKGRKEFILNSDFHPLKHPVRKDMAMLGNRTTGLAAIGLTSP